METREETQAARRVTWIGMILDAALGVAKIIIGTLFHSQALVADGVHSFSDVLSDLMVLGVFQASRKAPDREHPYGHDRFETFGTVVMGSLLIAVAGALAWDSIQRTLAGGKALAPGWPVLLVAALSILGKEWIYRYTRHVGEAIRSDLIVANAWHSRTDAFSSIIVFAGASGAMLGFLWLDALAAVGVAIIVGKVGWDLAWDNVKELVDTALPAEKTREVRRLALETQGVRDIHCVRSRRMGSRFLLELHLQVGPAISVSEGHQVGVRVVERIMQAMPEIQDITFHIDPENDDASEELSYPHLPDREQVREALKSRWGYRIDFSQVESIRLHYLGDKVSVELFLASTDAIIPESGGEGPLSRQLKTLAGDLRWLGRVRIWLAEADDAFSSA